VKAIGNPDKLETKKISCGYQKSKPPFLRSPASSLEEPVTNYQSKECHKLEGFNLQ